MNEKNKIEYIKPAILDLSFVAPLHGACATGGSAKDGCTTGNNASVTCTATGNSAGGGSCQFTGEGAHTL